MTGTNNAVDSAVTGVVIDATTRTPHSIGIIRTQGSVSVQTAKDIPSASDPIEAGKLAGFTVFVPAYLPEGYTAMTGWLVTSQDNGVVVFNACKDGTNNFIGLNQLRYGDGASKETYHRDQIVDVTVRGQSGVWLPDPSSPNGKNALVWEENGMTYSLISNSLPLDEMLKVAESLGK